MEQAKKEKNEFWEWSKALLIAFGTSLADSVFSIYTNSRRWRIDDANT